MPETFDSITYVIANHLCELQFKEISNPGAERPLCEVVFSVDGRRASDWIETEPTRFNYKSIRQIAKETIAKLNNWCKLHPNSFLYFCDYDFSVKFYKIYRLVGFVCDGRLEQYVTYIDARCQRTVFDGMLNFLPEECWQRTDLWRFIRGRYSKGDRETPVDTLKALLSEIALEERLDDREMWNWSPSMVNQFLRQQTHNYQHILGD